MHLFAKEIVTTRAFTIEPAEFKLEGNNIVFRTISCCCYSSTIALLHGGDMTLQRCLQCAQSDLNYVLIALWGHCQKSSNHAFKQTVKSQAPFHFRHEQICAVVNSFAFRKVVSADGVTVSLS